MTSIPRRAARAAASVVACLALLASCAVAERDPREDLRDAMKNDMRACGTDTDCLRKRQAARSRTEPATTSASTPASTLANEPRPAASR